ncbi:MAG: helix-turn-helix domain-containing protein [Planctomycetota bacterium]
MLSGSCAGERPVHPYRLEGFPGAPIDADLFPLRAGTRWVFEDRVDPDRGRLELELEAREGRLVLVGTKEGEAVVRIADVETEQGAERRLLIVFGVTVEQIVDAVADHFDVREDDIYGKQSAGPRWQATVELARRISVFLATELTSTSLEEIAGRFVGEARATTADAHDRIRLQAKEDPDLARALRRLQAELTAQKAYHVLKLEGKVGDQWYTKGSVVKKGTRYTVFGYDTVEVLGKPHRALVVAADRMPVRDLYWFAAGIGWVRIRTENEGRAKRDAFLVEFEPGGAN